MPVLSVCRSRRAAALLTLAGLATGVPASAAHADSSAGRAPISGSTAVARAKVWVDRGVGYSQSSTYQGYRMDCSGYVSMAWGLTKPGYTTYTMPSIGRYISKSDLRRGDAMLNSSFHVLLFDKWANSAKTYYWAYEESSSRGGAVYRQIPYPYWSGYGTFKPFRYKNMTS
ncbi:MAG: hypothetical protein V9G19_01905 [Tetrasphaera sp.]